MERVAETIIVPQQALATREGRPGLFVVMEDGKSVAWREVEVGIRDGERVEVAGEGLRGQVVVLGQQLLGDGSPIVISNGSEARP